MESKFVVGCVLSLSLVAVAKAQTFQLREGAGPIVTQGNTFLVAPNSSFDIEVWASLPTTISPSTVLGVAVAFGDAQGSGTSATPTNTFLQYTSWTWSNFATQNYPSSITNPQVRAAATPVAGNNYVTTDPNLLPIVAFGSRFASSATVPAGSSFIAVLTFQVGSVPLFSSQNLYVAHNGSANVQTGSSGINPGFGSTIYNVQVVPEPASMAAMAIGLIGTLLRKKRQKA